MYINSLLALQGNPTQTSNLNANGEGNETSGNVNKENAILLLMIIRLDNESY